MKVAMRAGASTTPAPWKKEVCHGECKPKGIVEGGHEVPCHKQRDDVKIYMLKSGSPRLLGCWQPDLYLKNRIWKDSSLEKLTGPKGMFKLILKRLVQLWVAWVGHPRQTVQLVQIHSHEGVWQVSGAARASACLTNGVHGVKSEKWCGQVQVHPLKASKLRRGHCMLFIHKKGISTEEWHDQI